jgi:DNA polymerase III epsilon subunit-like protein
MRLFFDVETTGIPRSRYAPLTDLDNWPRVVQLAWILTDESARECNRASMIIRPDAYTIPAEAARIHGITTAQAQREGVPIRSALTLLAKDLGFATLVIAHNYEFDYPVTAAEFIRASLGDPFAGRPHFCTMKSGTDVTRIPGRNGDYKWPTLHELHSHLFGEAPEKAHDALADVLSCARCYAAMHGAKAPKVASPRESAPMSEDDEELLTEVEELAGDCHWFDPSFVESVRGQFDDRGWISDKQRAALIRIRDRLSR